MVGIKAIIKSERYTEFKSLPTEFMENEKGIHSTLIFKVMPPQGASEIMTEKFHKNIRKSPMWKDIVAQ